MVRGMRARKALVGISLLLAGCAGTFSAPPPARQSPYLPDDLKAPEVQANWDKAENACMLRERDLKVRAESRESTRRAWAIGLGVTAAGVAAATAIYTGLAADPNVKVATAGTGVAGALTIPVVALAALGPGTEDLAVQRERIRDHREATNALYRKLVIVRDVKPDQAKALIAELDESIAALLRVCAE
jgi:hypothetical protein